ncbi:MAG: biotin--[acetyl-CoA-carboxylase] ligase [Bacteroidota bacterium]|nr:biotin--[acetyl-CoA-carboxylase] ligase [Bacteroidota bacterium]
MYKYEILKLDSVDSTQTFLMERDENLDLQEFYTVYTSNQSAGKGQGEHKWESEKDKNICFSFLLRPVFINPADQYIITQIISLAIVQTLRDYGLKEVKIKWPNDIYVKENKICGILVQNKIIGREFATSYVGIGININQTQFSFAPNPTSLCLETNKEFDKYKVFQKVMQNIIDLYTKYKYDTLNTLKQEYLNNLLFLNEYRNYEYLGKEIKAKIISTNSFGHLILQDEKENTYTAELRQLNFLINKV